MLIGTGSGADVPGASATRAAMVSLLPSVAVQAQFVVPGLARTASSPCMRRSSLVSSTSAALRAAKPRGAVPELAASSWLTLTQPHTIMAFAADVVAGPELIALAPVPGAGFNRMLWAL